MSRVTAARNASATWASAVVVLLAGVLVPGVMLAAPASACTAAAQPTARVGSPERDALDARSSDAVVVGTAVASYAPPAEPDSLSAPLVYTVEVDTVLKGTATRLERVLTYSFRSTRCGGGGGTDLELHQRMVVFLEVQSPPLFGARYTTADGNGNHAVASAADVHFPGALAQAPLPGGSIATASNTPGVGPSTQSQLLTAALVAGAVVIGAGASARLLRKHRRRRRTPLE